MRSLWNRIFGKKDPTVQPAVACAPRLAIAEPSPSAQHTGGASTHACHIYGGKFNLLGALCPVCGDSGTSLVDAPEWFAVLQAHVTAVQANDTAVRLFSEGRLDALLLRSCDAV